MKDRPILFSGPMVCANLEGRKTQTRRAVKFDGLLDFELGPAGVWHFRTEHGVTAVQCPYGMAGDLLWVRETLERGEEGWRYRADARDIVMDQGDSRVPQMVGWAHHVEREVCVSIHMPRWANRLALQIRDVRIERLQDISERDARREGLQIKGQEFMPSYRGADELPWRPEFPRDAYADLWDHINGPGSWDANPWVWVVTYAVHKAHVDQVLAQLGAAA